jgi:hemoglobin
MKKDIENIDDIRVLVDSFYDKVKNDDLIGPVFLDKIPGDWQPHLDKMYAFWNAALFGVKGYRGNPFVQHAPLQISPPHFERWLELFAATLDDHFEGSMATEAADRAGMMAQMFMQRLQQLNGDSSKVVM